VYVYNRSVVLGAFVPAALLFKDFEIAPVPHLVVKVEAYVICSMFSFIFK